LSLKRKDFKKMEKPDLIPTADSHQDENTVAFASLIPTAVGLSNDYIKAATSNNTRIAYRQDIRHFEASGGKLPATPDIICRYLTSFANRLNPRTLNHRLIAIKHWHLYQSFPDPTQHPVIHKTMAGIYRIHGQPKMKAHALTLEELAQIVDHLQSLGNIAADRDNALLQIGFFGAFRRSELVAIHCEHINWQKEGVEILISTSKTDQFHDGQHVAIPFGNKQLCPLRALEKWLVESGIKAGPIFRPILASNQIGEKALTPLSVNHILKSRAKAVGLMQVYTQF
jgi:site-specific recombinase XerD